MPPKRILGPKAEPVVKPKTKVKREADSDLSSEPEQHINKKPRVKKAKSSAWSKQEVRQLWAALDIVPSKVSWDAVAAKVEGRSKIACRDKWLKDILPRLAQFIDSRGE